jgi:hydrogenase large subunit
MGTLGGKWPHTGSVLPGGSSRAIEAAERLRLLAKLREMRSFLEQTLFGSALEEVAALASEADLQAWSERASGSDLALFLEMAADAQLHGLGVGPGRYLSYGAYAQPQGGHALAAGVWNSDTHSRSVLEPAQISEDARHAWLAEGPGTAPLHPAVGLTQPELDKPGAYSWNKAPRLAGQVVETGAIARQLVSGQALIRAATLTHGGTVYTRVLARLVEVALILPLMEQWLMALVPRAPFYLTPNLPEQGQGMGLTEAARGALGHWLRIDKGRISHYQIVAPTSWNFSPRDRAGTPGALEAALAGAPLDSADAAPGSSVAVQHIVRSFDPCMACTVH